MNYELAKELKEAGFPQEGKGTYWPDNPQGEGDSAYVPTLEELIEACGEDLSSLGRYIDDDCAWRADMSEEAFERWEASLPQSEEGQDPYRCGVQDCCGYETGPTPTEAVARLWLVLNNGRNGD